MGKGVKSGARDRCSLFRTDVSRRLRIGDMTSPGGGAAAPAAAAPSDPAALLAALMSTDNNVRSQAEVSTLLITPILTKNDIQIEYKLAK